MFSRKKFQIEFLWKFFLRSHFQKCVNLDSYIILTPSIVTFSCWWTRGFISLARCWRGRRSLGGCNRWDKTPLPMVMESLILIWTGLRLIETVQIIIIIVVISTIHAAFFRSSEKPEGSYNYPLWKSVLASIQMTSDDSSLLFATDFSRVFLLYPYSTALLMFFRLEKIFHPRNYAVALRKLMRWQIKVLK